MRRADDLRATNRKFDDQQCQGASLPNSRKSLQDGDVGRNALGSARVKELVLLLVQLGLRVPVNPIKYFLLCDLECVVFKVRRKDAQGRLVDDRAQLEKSSRS